MYIVSCISNIFELYVFSSNFPDTVEIAGVVFRDALVTKVPCLGMADFSTPAGHIYTSAYHNTGTIIMEYIMMYIYIYNETLYIIHFHNDGKYHYHNDGIYHGLI